MGEDKSDGIVSMVEPKVAVGGRRDMLTHGRKNTNAPRGASA